MITALDHFVLLCPDIEQGVADYTAIMGFGPAWRAEEDGRESALFTTGNTAVELLAPKGEGPTAERIRGLLAQGDQFASLVYRTDQIDEAHRLMTRRGLAPDEIVEGRSADLISGSERSWRRFRLDDSAASFALSQLSPWMPSRVLFRNLIILSSRPPIPIALWPFMGRGSAFGLRSIVPQNSGTRVFCSSGLAICPSKSSIGSARATTRRKLTDFGG